MRNISGDFIEINEPFPDPDTEDGVRFFHAQFCDTWEGQKLLTTFGKGAKGVSKALEDKQGKDNDPYKRLRTLANTFIQSAPLRRPHQALAS